VLSKRSNNTKGDCEFYCDNVALSDIVAQVGTPAYVYSKKSIQESYNNFSTAFQNLSSLICVSVKANSNLALLSLLNSLGSGFDVVSGGELERTLLAGGDPKKIVFSGVGKSDEEILLAIKAGILMFNVESLSELEQINKLSNSKVRVSLRVNPNVDAKTHKHVNTGLNQHKFGLPLQAAHDIYKRAREFTQIEFVGIDCHIGSMITGYEVFESAFSEIANFVDVIKSFIPTIKYVDLGGGLSVPYKDEVTLDIDTYAQLVKKHFGKMGVTLVFEPGRYIFANAGVLISKVLHTKEHADKNFVIVDAGFNDLMRPLIYDAYHHIEPVLCKSRHETKSVDVVGPVCETGDCFAKNRTLPILSRGDLITICSVGAYGFSMASNYNSRVRPVEVLVDDVNWHIIRSRESLSFLLYDEVERLGELHERS
jgi:diaminopimelate decarboxylase